MSRHALPDRDRTRLEPLLPQQRTGRSPKDHRISRDASFWLSKTGAPRRDLPGRYGPRRTAATWIAEHQVQIETWARGRGGSGESGKVTEGTFTFVAIDANGKPRELRTGEREERSSRCEQPLRRTCSTEFDAMERTSADLYGRG